MEAIRRALEQLGCRVTLYEQPEAGHPRLRAVHPGWRVAAFVAPLLGRPDAEERRWHNHECRAGGTVIVARTAGEAVSGFASLRRSGA